MIEVSRWISSLFIVLFPLGIATKVFPQTRFLMGYSSFSANQTPIWMAKDEGLFKRFGTDPDLILIEGGTRGAQALISADIPIMGMSGQPVISARARGADLTMIAGTVNKMNYVLIGAPAIKRPEDLKGKRIGAAQAGTASYHAVGISRSITVGVYGGSLKPTAALRFRPTSFDPLGVTPALST